MHLNDESECRSKPFIRDGRVHYSYLFYNHYSLNICRRNCDPFFLSTQNGTYTWPIVLLSYIYVRLDLSFMADRDDRGLLIAFLTALYDPLYITQCQTLYSLVPAPAVVNTLGKSGVAMLVASNNATKFIFEIATQPYDGQGNYVISSNRRTYADLQRSDLAVQTTALATAVASYSSAPTPTSDNQNQKNIMRTHVAFGLSILSILLWAFLLIAFAVKLLCCRDRDRKDGLNSSLM